MKLLASRWSTALLAAAFAAGALPAQQRRPIVGAVVDAKGLAVAAADVTLVMSPPGGPDCGPADIVQATTDARGRFVARLLPQESYSAWATAGAGDAARSSRVHEGVAAGGDLHLVLERTVASRPVRLGGVEGWSDAGPLTTEFSPRAVNVGFWPAKDAQTPRLPDLARLLVRDGKGEPLVLVALAENDDRPERPVFLPQRFTQRLAVVDENRAPVANARVYCHIGQDPAGFTPGGLFDRPPYRAVRLLGRTDEGGRAVLAVPQYPVGPTRLYVRREGHAEAQVAIDVPNNQTYVDGQQQVRDADGSNVVVLGRAGRLQVLRAGVPVLPFAAFVTASFGGAVPQDREAALSFGPDGLCDIPLPANPAEAMLHVRTGPDAPWELQRLTWAPDKTTKVELAAQRLLSLQFLDETGGPARGMSGMLMPINSALAARQQIAVTTDQSGRLVRTLGPDAWFLFLTDGVRWGRVDVPLSGAKGTAAELPAKVACQRLVTGSLRLVDAAGKPIAGSHVESLWPIPKAGIAPGPQEQFLVRTLARLCASRTSAADGVLTIPCVRDAPFDLTASIRATPTKVQNHRVSPGETLTVQVQ